MIGIIKNEFIRAQLSKIKFLLGLNPKIESFENNSLDYIPESFKAVCLISVDFELAWAFRFTKSTRLLNQQPAQLGLQTRYNIPKIIQLCELYEIPLTWATVGHLFLESCQKINGVVHPEIKRLPKFENEFWIYKSGDWFSNDPCSDYIKDPAWYCPDLIQDILRSPIGHEIGCHTFSHIDCRDEICSETVFQSEINACKNAAKKFGIQLESFVHPGHLIGNLDTLSNSGFTSYRTDFGNTLALPKKHSSGLWELKNSACIDYREKWTDKYHVKRFTGIIKKAIKYNKVCVLWFHPSFNPILLETVLPEIFKFLHNNNDKIWVTTHKEYVNYLNQICKENNSEV